MSSIFSRIRDHLLNLRHLVIIGIITFILILGTASFLGHQNYWAARMQIHRDFNQQQLVLAQQAVFQINSITSPQGVLLSALRDGNYRVRSEAARDTTPPQCGSAAPGYLGPIKIVCPPTAFQ